MKKIICTLLIFSLMLMSACSTKNSNKTSGNEAASTKPSSSAVMGTSSPAGSANAGGTKSAQAAAKTIVIDPGHANKADLSTEPNAPGSTVMKAKESGGAEGVYSHTPEYAINMKVALKLKSLLEAVGYRVVMTKTSNSVMLGNVERAKIGNNENAALVIRIHADSRTSQSINGASMLVPAKINRNTTAIADTSKRYGRIILDTLVSKVGMADKGVVERNDLTGFNWSQVPVVLVEMGFLSNVREDKLLNTDEYQNKIASALASGIETAVPLKN